MKRIDTLPRLLRKPLIATLATAFLLPLSPASADLYQWSGQGGSDSFGETGNWTEGTPVSTAWNDYVFTGSSRLSPVLGSTTWQAQSIAFSPEAGSFNLGGYAPGESGPIANNRFSLAAASSIVQNSASDQRISSVIYLGSGTATVSGSGTGALTLEALRFNAPSGGSFDFQRSATIGLITAAGSGTGEQRIRLINTGTLTFSAANTGTLTRLEIASGSEVGNVLEATHASGLTSQAHLQSNRGVTFGGSGRMEFQGGLTLDGNTNKTFTFSNTGGTTFSGLPVQFGAANGTADRVVTLEVGAAATATLDAEITGSRSAGQTAISKSGAGTLVFSGANTYNGGTTVAEGVLLVENATGSATGTGSVRIEGGVLGGHGIIAPEDASISVGNATLAVGLPDDAFTSGVTRLTFARQGGTVGFSLEETSTLHLQIWSAADYEQFAFDLDTIDLGNATLTLSSAFEGFEAGQSYRLFDWGEATLSGQFAGFILPQLGDGLAWNTDALYSSGVVSIAVIPEPGTLGLLAFVLAGFGGLWVGRRSRQGLLRAGRFLPVALAGALCTGSALAGTPATAVFTAKDEVEIGKNSSHRYSLESAGAPVDHELVLEFTAWYQADRPGGFLQHMKVFFNGEELSDILDRPAIFTAKDERPREVYGKEGWRVAILSAPQEAHDEQSRYHVPGNEMPDITRFRFRLPVFQPGEQEIEIRNLIRTDITPEGREIAATLKIRDLVVLSQPR